MAEYIIEIKNLVSKYGEKIIHENLNLKIKKGEIVAIVGGSGSGKTTLFRELLMLKEISGGSVKINGMDITTIGEKAKQKIRNMIGVLFQSAALFSSFSVGENIVYAIRKRYNISYNLAKELAILKIDLADLEKDVFNLYPFELSGGMRKKAGLARALSIDPQILFLDEPTSGLDPISADEFDKTIKKLNKLLGITVVIITHDIATLNVTDNVAVLANKKIIYFGPPYKLKDVDNEWIHKLISGERGKVLNG